MTLLEVADYSKKTFGKRNHFESYADARLHEFNIAITKDHGFKDVLFNSDEIERLNMVMSAPYADCVCQNPVPIGSYIMKFYNGDFLMILTNMMGLGIYCAIRKCQNIRKIWVYEFSLDSRPDRSILPVDGLKFQYLDVLLVQNYLFCLALSMEEWLMLRETTKKYEKSN